MISDLKFGTFQKLDLPGRPDPVGNVASQFAEVPESFAWPEPEDVVPAEALHSAGRQVEKLLIIGGGPKAAAVCAKCCILRDLDLPAPKPVVFEQHVLAAAWTGRHGYTTGTLRLGTSPEKDVGFPYFEDSKNAQVTSELFRRFSWTNYLRKLGTFAEWIDRGRPHPTHKQYSDYISWVITNSIQKDEKIIGTVQEIHPQNGGWRVVVQIGDQRKEFEGDKLLVTGTGKAKRPEFEFPRDKNILFGDNFWTEENLKLLDAVREDSDPIAIVGGGETAASIAEYLTEKLGPRRIPIIIITRNGTIFSRGEGYYENRVFTHHEEWEELPEDVRLETIRRADRGVFSQGVVAKLSQDSRVRHFCVDVQKIEVGEGSTGLLRIIGKKHKNRDKNQIIPCQLLIFAMGFDSLFFAEMIKDDQLSKTLRKRVKGMYAIERQIGDDLSVSASISPSKLYLPALAGLARGPGFPNLSCLGVLSDRILGRSPKTPAAPRSTITPKPRSR